MRHAWLVLMISAWGLAVNARGEGPDDEFFERAVRPILVARCQECHPATGKTKGGLRLDTRDSILKGGDSGPAAVPHMPDESLIIQAIRYGDEPRMPPKSKLADSEITTLTKWVELGLPWPKSTAASSSSANTETGTSGFTAEQRGFWAFQPVRDVEPPAVRDTAWPRNEIDRFILNGLEANGLKPAAEADRRTWLRRVTFDLVGLPPTPEEIQAFLDDEGPDAHAKVVDRLLANPHYGERWARHWLDVVRYADSLDSRGSGSPGDILDAWRYRDWVVNALNRDLPYDRFVHDQVAGDIRPENAKASAFDREGTIASTLLAIGNWGNGDADKDKVLTDIADDQVDVVSKAFLGLTIACARCHDHKFDPITQDDYYGLAGIFFSTHILPKLTPKGAGETILRVPLASPAELAERDAQTRRIAELEQTIAKQRAEHARALAHELRPQAGVYLLAAWDYQHRPASRSAESLAAFASERGLQAILISRWLEFLSGPESRPLGTKAADIGGIPGVLAWKGAGTGSTATANTTDVRRAILTFTLPPRSISVHPGPNSSAVVSWTSPIAGRVRITGRVADGDAACGDGFAWAIDHRSTDGPSVLANGEVANGGAMALGQGKDAEKLASVAVRTGDRIELVILRGKEYSCDTTTIDLVIASWSDASTWDVTRDCLDDFHSGNPHADRLGHAGVWQFGDNARQRVELDAADAGLTAWRAAIRSGADRARLEAAADEFARGFTIDDERSPFWVRDAAGEALFPAEARTELASARAELERLRVLAARPLDYANAAQEGGVPESPHAGTHDVAIHIRGRYDRLGALVPRHFPVVLEGSIKPIASAGSGRVELARWLTRPDHPLTARVIVNRVWQHHFGAGLVRTPSNFGKLGEPPTHPELLDWLARRFVSSGWSIKALHRLILLSAVARQSSVPDPVTLERDPENRLLGRMPRQRLEAEVIRDNFLAVSGRFNPALGGPAIRDPNTFRRGLYVITIRSDRSTFGALFDQADSTSPVDRRVVSIIAPQALYTLNSAFALDQARALARRLIEEVPGSDQARVERAYLLLFGRPPRADELAIVLEVLAKARQNGAAELDAWTAPAEVLLNTNEFLFVD